ncbi:MAG: peptidylprolyl isomerase [Euryarchaeota archaeon]|nr:peptidylprolyl isomerase [Euryarchaeota archaeon]
MKRPVLGVAALLFAMGVAGCLGTGPTGYTGPFDHTGACPVDKAGVLGNRTAFEFSAARMDHAASNRLAIICTTTGWFVAELFENKAPISTANFIKYASDGFYEGTVFHRVIDNFVIQGGGVLANGTEKPTTYPSIELENQTGLRHWDGAWGMARETEPDTATAQFYVCDGPQHRLDDDNFKIQYSGAPGYAVFAQTIDGMEIVAAIASVQTDSADRPIQDVTTTRVTIVGQ